MKLTWHIIKKDLRRHAWAYSLWIALLGTKLGLALTMMEAGNPDPEWFKWMANAHAVAVVVESLVGFLLMASWVLADETTGSSVFWVTRPISGWRLLSAKLTGAALFFVVVPGFVPLIWQLYSGSPATMIYTEIGRTWLMQAGLVGTAFGLAALTGRSSVFVRALLLAIAFGMLAGLYKAMMASATLPTPGTVVATRSIVATMLFGLTVAGVAALQYGWRRNRLAWVVALLGVLAVVGIKSSWPWAFIAAETVAAGTVTATKWDGRLQAAFTGLQFGALSSSTKAVDGYRTALAKFLVMGDIGEDRWRTRSPQIEIEFADGTRFAQECRQSSGGFQLPTVPRETLGLKDSIFERDPETKEYLAERKARRPRFSNEARFSELACLLYLPDSVAARLQTESATLRLRLPVAISTPEVLWESPLVDGGSVAGGGARARILRAEAPTFQSSGNPKVLSPDQFTAELVFAGSRALRPVDLVVLQRSNGYASDPARESRAYSATIDTAGVHRTAILYRYARVRRNGAWEVAPENAGPRTLAAIAYRDVATIVLTNETQGVTLAK